MKLCTDQYLVTIYNFGVMICSVGTKNMTRIVHEACRPLLRTELSNQGILLPVAGVVISTTSSIITFHHWQKVIEVCERYLRENRLYVGEVVCRSCSVNRLNMQIGQSHCVIMTQYLSMYPRASDLAARLFHGVLGGALFLDMTTSHPCFHTCSVTGSGVSGGSLAS